MENIQEWLVIILAVVGGASSIVLGFEKIAKVTPSTKDDLYVGKAKKAVGWVLGILSKVALNPK
jgi:hypothetical protein